MKKIMMMLVLVVGISVITHAQTTKPKAKVETADHKIKAKPKTTASDKVHNVIHPKRKHYSGVKVKGKKED
jgi:hypothetical protein